VIIATSAVMLNVTNRFIAASSLLKDWTPSRVVAAHALRSS